MKKLFLFFTLLPISAIAETNTDVIFNNALNSVRTQCSGISDKLEPLKKMAGIGTAVNAIGTASGIGGVASGIAKHNTDKNIASEIGEKYSIEIIKEKLKAKELSTENQAAFENFRKIASNINWKQLEQDLNKLSDNLDEQERQESIKELEKKEAELQNKINENQAKSDKYGNVRTGLFATNTATNIAGAIVSSKTKVDETLQEKIKACTESITKLRDATMRYQVENTSEKNIDLLSKSQQIINACGEYQYIDTNSLNKLAKGATVSGTVGAVTSAAATISSISGTSNKLSDIDLKNPNAEKEINKIENTNTASNVLGGITVATSLTGTILNATQIKKIKQIVSIADKCEEALN